MVKFDHKFLQGSDGFNMFQFRVATHGKPTGFKVKKKYSDFQYLKALVDEQAQKQSDLFGDSSLLGVNDDVSTRSYKQSGIV